MTGAKDRFSAIIVSRMAAGNFLCDLYGIIIVHSSSIGLVEVVVSISISAYCAGP